MQRLLLAAIAVCAIARDAAAEINMADSIEWQTIDSDAVVRGFVTAVTKHESADKSTWYDLTIQISETIKGGAKQVIHVGYRSFSGNDAQTWAAKKTDLLLFLVEGKRARDDKDLVRLPYIPRHVNGSGASIYELGATQGYTATFAAITKDTDVLAAVRTAAKSPARTSFRVDVPWDTPAMKALYGGSAVWLTVPVDAALEKHALAQLASKSAWERAEAVEALGNFRSTANIELVKKALGDTEFATGTFDGREGKRWLVRVAADKVLKAWAVPHTTPVLEDLAPAVK